MQIRRTINWQTVANMVNNVNLIFCNIEAVIQYFAEKGKIQRINKKCMSAK